MHDSGQDGIKDAPTPQLLVLIFKLLMLISDPQVVLSHLSSLINPARHQAAGQACHCTLVRGMCWFEHAKGPHCKSTKTVFATVPDCAAQVHC